MAVRHIGPRRARRLIDALGFAGAYGSTSPPRVFGTVCGVGSRQADEAAQSWRASFNVAPSAVGPGTSTNASL